MTSEFSPRAWRIAAALILLLAAVLRFYDLDLKPLHSDEGVNGFFVTRLFREGFYRYDPAAYHGPTLYYFALITTTINSLFFGKYGLSTFAIRSVPVLFGMATVWLVLHLRRHLGAVGGLSAATLVAVSPGAVYFSRDFIHETPFVFFTLALVVAGGWYYETARPTYLLLASASAALLFATKETALISAVVLALALLCTVVYQRLRRAAPRRVIAKSRRPVGWERFGSRSRIAILWLVAVLVFLNGIVSFYSSFFTQPQSVAGVVETFKFWVKTGQTAHRYAWYKYLELLSREELPLLVLGVAGAALAVWRASNRFALFAGLWAFGLLGAYSLTPYKTPWLALNFIVPLALVGGYAVEVISGMGKENRHRRAWSLVLAIVVPALCIALYQTIRLNFHHYDDDRYPYVYAQTRRGFLRLVDEINEIAGRAGTGKQTTVTVTSPDYWPLPWYLRDSKNVSYYGRVIAPQEKIVVCSEKQEPELLRLLAGRYERVGSYPLRPGVTLVLFARHDAGP